MKTLYQIQSLKSGRKFIYDGFDKYHWSVGDELYDGTFLTKEEVDFVLKFANIDVTERGEHGLIRFKIEELPAWPYLKSEISMPNRGGDEPNDL